MFLNRTYNTDGLQAPRGRSILNKASPLAQGLIGLWQILPSGHLFDLVSESLTPPPTDASIKISSLLSTHQIDDATSANQGLTPAVERLPTGRPLSMAAWAAQNTDAGNGIAIGLGDTLVTANNYVTLGYGAFAAGLPAWSTRDGGSAIKVVGPTDLRGTGLHLLVGTVTSETNGKKLYVDGEFVAEGDDQNTITMDTLIIIEGIRTVGRFEPLNGQFVFGGLWNRELSATEIHALYNPETRWDLFWQPSNKLYFFPVVVAAAGANPKGPLGHPLHGAFGGPV